MAKEKPLNTPECEIVLEKVHKAFSALDAAQQEVHAALASLDEREQGVVKSAMQTALAGRLSHMTIGGLSLPDAQVNECALGIVDQLNILARDMRRALGQGRPQPKH